MSGGSGDDLRGLRPGWSFACSRFQPKPRWRQCSGDPPSGSTGMPRSFSCRKPWTVSVAACRVAHVPIATLWGSETVTVGKRTGPATPKTALYEIGISYLYKFRSIRPLKNRGGGEARERDRLRATPPPPVANRSLLIAISLDSAGTPPAVISFDPGQKQWRRHG